MRKREIFPKLSNRNSLTGFLVLQVFELLLRDIFSQGFLVPKVGNEMCIILELFFLFCTLYDQILKDIQYKSQCLNFYQYLP